MDEQYWNRLNRVLTWILAIVLITSMGGVTYIALTPYEEADSFTEFYILGPDGKASNYPDTLTVGESGELIVGIVNHEREPVDYTVVLILDDRMIETETVRVDSGETWEEPFSFTPNTTGEKQLEIRLYKGTNPEISEKPYDDLRLWIDVLNKTINIE